MKKFFYSFMALACIAIISGCAKDEEELTGSIYGIVRSAVNNESIAGASVQLLPNGTQVVTGSDGSYEFTDLEPGQYRIKVEHAEYQGNIKTINVVVGKAASGDIQLQKGNGNLVVNPSALDFGTGQSTLTFSISNQGTSGDLDWTINSSDAWFKATPTQGRTAMGKSTSVVVSIDRSLLQESSSGILTVNYNGGSTTLLISASVAGSSDGGEDKPGETPETPQEDYSTAQTTSPDPRLEVGIISCRRSGTNLVFNYFIKNIGFGRDIEAFDVYSINTNTYSYLIDGDGKNYAEEYPTFVLADQKPAGNSVRIRLLEDIKANGTITVKNFSTTAKTVNVGLRAQVYTPQSLQMAGDMIVFKNVPIY